MTYTNSLDMPRDHPPALDDVDWFEPAFDGFDFAHSIFHLPLAFAEAQHGRIGYGADVERAQFVLHFDGRGGDAGDATQRVVEVHAEMQKFGDRRCHIENGTG